MESSSYEDKSVLMDTRAEDVSYVYGYIGVGVFPSPELCIKDNSGLI